MATNRYGVVARTAGVLANSRCRESTVMQRMVTKVVAMGGVAPGDGVIYLFVTKTADDS